MATAKKNASRTTIGRRLNGVGSTTADTDTGSTRKKTTVGSAKRAGVGFDMGESTNKKTPPKPAPPPVVSQPHNVNDALNSRITTGGGTGGGSNLPAGARTTGTGGDLAGQEFTGWASGIRPDAVPLMFQEPQALLRQVMAKMGMSAGDNPGLYNLALPNADPNLLAALSLVFQGSNPGFNQGENNAVLNSWGDFMSQGLTRGGKGVDFSQGIDNILGTSPNSDTALGGYLNLDDPRGQVNAVKSLVGALASQGLHPAFAKALSNQIDRLADEYYQQTAYGTPDATFQQKIDRLF